MLVSLASIETDVNKERKWEEKGIVCPSLGC
jgi:hypothetical protein